MTLAIEIEPHVSNVEIVVPTASIGRAVFHSAITGSDSGTHFKPGVLAPNKAAPTFATAGAVATFAALAITHYRVQIDAVLGILEISLVANARSR